MHHRSNQPTEGGTTSNIQPNITKLVCTYSPKEKTSNIPSPYLQSTPLLHRDQIRRIFIVDFATILRVLIPVS